MGYCPKIIPKVVFTRYKFVHLSKETKCIILLSKCDFHAYNTIEYNYMLGTKIQIPEEPLI